MAIFFRQGKKPANPVNQTNKCNTCEPTMTTITPNQAFDTERDALVAWRLFRKNLVDTWGKSAWDELFKNFQCTNNKCKNQKPCGNKPTYIEVGSRLFRPPGQLAQWKLYLTLAREIQCVDETPKPKDVVPELPDPTPKKKDDDEPKKDDGPGEDEGMEPDSPKMMFVSLEDVEPAGVDDIEIVFGSNGGRRRKKG